MKAALFELAKLLRRRLGDSWLRLAIFFSGAAALLWFLIRVIPKPSRASYPCQRAAFPAASGFVIWLCGVLAIGRLGHNLRRHRVAIGSGLGVLTVLGLASWTLVSSTGGVLAYVTPNNPMGIARGINPGRVVWSRDPAATSWSGSKDGTHWWDPDKASQARVDVMLSRSLRKLTGTTSDAAAWDALFRSFNQRRGNGNLSYQDSPRKVIAVKINQNPANQANTDYYAKNGVSGDEYAITGNPHVILALVRQLAAFGVQETNIIICDPSGLNRGWGGPRTIGDNIYTYVHPLYPGVRFVDGVGKQGRELAVWPTNDCIVYPAVMSGENGANGKKIAQQILDAGFFINMAIMKHHGDGPTLCGKNNYGSISGQRHGTLYGDSAGNPFYSNLVELMGHQDLGEKTVLFMIDTLYGANGPNNAPIKWTKAPFSNAWPSSLFVSQDGVAIDSVGFDFMNAEWGMPTNTDNYLHEAAYVPGSDGKKLSGQVYQPNAGSTNRLGSLGVHEHWNNATERKYSRNLDPTNGTGIELVALMTGGWSVEVTNPANGATFSPGDNISLKAEVVNATNAISRVVFYQNATLSLGSTSNSPYAITWSNAPAGSVSVTAVATDNSGRSVTSSPVSITVVSVIATNPPNLTMSLSNGQVKVGWPPDHTGWTLQMQTNPWPAGIGSNWVSLTNLLMTNLLVEPADPGKGSVFYRLKYL